VDAAGLSLPVAKLRAREGALGGPSAKQANVRKYIYQYISELPVYLEKSKQKFF